MLIHEYLTVSNLLKVAVITASSYIILKLIERIFITPLKEKYKGPILVVRRIIRVTISVFAFIFILGVFNIDVTALITGLGIGGIIIGFGLKDIISNWICGMIILGERIYRIGDVVKVGEIVGVVKDISLRSTKLRTYDRNEVIIPNSVMVNEKIINLTRGRQKTVVSMTFLVDYTNDIEKVKKAIEKVLRKHKKVIIDEKSEIKHIVRIREWTVEIETLYWINDPENREFIRSEIVENVKKEFEREKILPPIPPLLREKLAKL